MERTAALVCLLLVSWGAIAYGDSEALRFDPAPATYHHDIVLSMSPSQPNQTLFYRVSIEGASQNASTPLRYSVPLSLTALPGEKRSYHISVAIHEGTKTIKTVQSIWTVDRRVVVAAGEQPARVAAGSQSTRARPSVIPMLSPVAGTFGNRQLLYVDTADFSWVRYTTDGSDPVTNGTEYHSPVVIDKTGAVELKVAALRKGAAKPLTAEVRFTVDLTTPSPLSASQGESARPVQLSPPKSLDFHYAFGERSPDQHDLQFTKPLTIGAPPDSLAFTVLRLRSLGSSGAWGPQFRYFFAIDRRAAPPPVISLVGGTVATPRTRVRILDAPYTTLYYTVDGSTPDRSKELYAEPFAPKLPENGEGTLTIRARAYAPNGEASEVVSQTYPYHTKTPPPPTVSFERNPPGTTDTIVHVKVDVPPGSTIVYERTLDGSAPPDPTAGSPESPPALTLSLPRGAAADFALKFATVNAVGAISQPSQVLRIRIDKRPPPEPVISFQGDTLTLSGSGEVLYVLSENGVAPSTVGPRAQRYQGSIRLAGKPNRRVEYYVAAVATASNGMPSEVSRGGPFVVDLRDPGVPVVWGVQAGGLYNDDRVMHIEQREGISVHFTLSTNGQPPEDPTLSSPIAAASMPFSIASGSEMSFVLKLRAAIGTRIGPVDTIPFTIDRIPPSIPPLQDFPPSGLVNHSVTIPPPTMPLGESLFYGISTNGKAPDPLGSAGRPFEAPLVLGAPQGQELTYHLRLASRDAAGNAAEGSSVYVVTIDRKLPPTPAIDAIPAGGTVTGKVTVTIRGSASAIHYDLSSDGSEPPPPSADSPVYKQPLVLEAKNGEATLYTLLAAAEDAAGNMSSQPAIYRVLVLPSATEQAAGQGSRNAGRATPASAPAVPKAETLLTGARDGGLYNTAVTLRPSRAAGVLRYTIDPNGGRAPQVTQFSPELPEQIALDPLPGETRRYALRVAAFAGSDSTNPTAEQALSFTIDRTPPAPPTIAGVVNNGRYQKAETFSLLASDDTIYYALQKVSPIDAAFPQSPTSFRKYQGAVAIGAGEASARYRIRAYAVDPAGNRSLATAEWTVYFDRGVVYVAQGGSDSADGTSRDPVKTLNRALTMALDQGRGTVFLAGGHYTLDQAFRIASSVRLEGNFKASDWQQVAGAGPTDTTVTVPADAAAAPLLAIDGGSVTADHLAFNDLRDKGVLFDLRRGSLSVRAGLIVSHSAEEPIITATNATLRFNDVTMDNRGGGSNISMQGSRLDVTGGAFAAAATTGDSILLTLADGSQGTIKSSVFHPSAGLRAISVEAVDSQLALDHCTLRAGTATRESVGLFARGATVQITDSSLVGSAYAHLSFGIQAQDSTVNVSESDLKVEGSSGATGIWTDGSQLELSRSLITGAATSEFLYLVKTSSSKVRIVDSILRGAASGQYLGIALTASRASVVGNTLYGGSGRDDASAIEIESSPVVDIVDNIIARPGASEGQAVSIASGATLPRIIANDIFGYPVILAIGGGPSVTSIDGLNAVDGVNGGGPIRGNLSEPLEETFQSTIELHLKTGSRCIGGGVDPKPFGGGATDYSGTTRKAPYDIGAFAFR